MSLVRPMNLGSNTCCCGAALDGFFASLHVASDVDSALTPRGVRSSVLLATDGSMTVQVPGKELLSQPNGTSQDSKNYVCIVGSAKKVGSRACLQNEFAGWNFVPAIGALLPKAAAQTVRRRKWRSMTLNDADAPQKTPFLTQNGNTPTSLLFLGRSA